MKILMESDDIQAIGVGVVALWLTDPVRHFELFESLVLKIALRGFWQDGEFIEPPADDFAEFLLSN